MANIDIVRQRLANQSLTRPVHETPAQVVAMLGAVQAQDFAGAKWALGQRMVNATDAALDTAFSAGEILRTHVLRPTWHFVAPQDIRWLLKLSAPRVHAASAFRYRQLELDEATLKRTTNVFVKTLQGGKQKTRDELRAALEHAGIPTDGQRIAYMVMYAELEGVLVSGARRGKQFTYALLDERAPHAEVLPRDDALYEITRRYFSTRGPATIQDFVWWSGFTMRDAKQSIAACGSQLVSEQIGEQTYWFVPQNALPKTKTPVAHLLPYYDEYTVGFQDRSAIIDGPLPPPIDPRTDSLLNPIILINGKFVGRWKRTLSKNAVTVEINLVRALSSAEERAVSNASKQYAAFLQLPLVLETNKNAAQ
jgi:hypothetical protein